MLRIFNSDFHQYLLTCNGIKTKDRVFSSRQEAKKAMYDFCDAHNIRVECTDDSKHYKLYQNSNKSISFCINRI